MEERNLLKAVVLVSEKAANIARAIREEEHLFSLLVREKKDDEKNPRFAHDFKTLADVLVQEVVKHDLGKEFPDLVGQIFGEESNEFSCADGESVCLCVGSSEADTRDQLMKVLDHESAAQSLARLVHSQASVDLEVPPCDLSAEQLAVWIDPIDSTVEYITGGAAASDSAGVYKAGLPCVTVLIGIFHRHSGQPVLGVINQPFNRQHGLGWVGSIVWGVCSGDINMSSTPKPASLENNKVVVLSGSESEEVKRRLSTGGFTLLEAAGAGYKLLCVAEGLACAYVLSKPTTFFWDTCGAHAVLTSRGGGVVKYAGALRGADDSLRYTGGVGTEQCCNNQGFIAYADPYILEQVVSLLQ